MVAQAVMDLKNGGKDDFTVRQVNTMLKGSYPKSAFDEVQFHTYT
jgi:hypothetical protein